MRGLETSIRHLRPWKFVLVAQVWWTFLWLLVQVQRRPLPQVVQRLDEPPRILRASKEPRRLSLMSFRALRFGPYRPRCLYRALVLFRLLRIQGDRPVVVIGLPEGGSGTIAHAWVELDGRDIGPPPGRAGNIPLVAYPDADDRQAL